MLRRTTVLSRVAVCSLTLALAATFTVAPAVTGIGGMDDAAYAQGKSGDKGNRGGDKDRGGKDRGDKDRGGKDRGDKDRGGKDRGGKAFKETGFGKKLNGIFGKKTKTKTAKVNHGQTKKAAAVASASGSAAAASVDTEGLHPKQKGRWNAKPAQAALDAHIRNQNFNGTVGMLSKYDLAMRAYNDPESLNEYDIAAMESLGYELRDPEVGDYQDFVDNDLAGEDYPEGAEFEVVENPDGTLSVECTNCDELTNEDGEAYTEEEIAGFNDDAQAELDGYSEDAYRDVNAETLEGLYRESEGDIIGNSNKDPSGYEDQLLDDVASGLGEERAQDITDYPSPEEEDLAELDLDEEAEEIVTTE